MQTTRGTSLSDSTNPERQAGETAGSPRPRRVGVLVAVALAALAADIVSKIIVVSTLQDRAPVRLLGGLLTLRETRNSGAAFSIGTGYTIVFTLIACGVVVAILRTARNLRSAPWAVCLGLLLGGAVGNLIDRLLRAPAPLKGHVVDWIQLPHWPVFNLADSAIVCGGVLAVLLAARGLQVDGTRLKDDAPGTDGAPNAGESPEAGASPGTGGTAEGEGPEDPPKDAPEDAPEDAPAREPEDGAEVPAPEEKS
ncbi:signal peptidase II [Actinomadura citrea]|uniref:signal peptidase II n=1 Tax=Actinomadura citrea TaxID=46158 RepID=UPI002E2B6831|nr:signal peptidase II [Actinomadura citrea]